MNDQLIGIASAGAVVPLVVAVGVYVWTSLALMALFAKAGEAPGKAWVPVLNAWVLFERAGMRGWWAVVLAGGGVVVGLAATAVGAALTSAALGASFSGDAGGAQSSLAAALLVPALLWLVFLVPAVVLQVFMLRGIGRRFGVGVAFVVLGVFLFPVWASVLGWGSARWLGDALRATHPSGSPAPVAPAAASQPAAPPLADFSPRPGAGAPRFPDTPTFAATGSDRPAQGVSAAGPALPPLTPFPASFSGSPAASVSAESGASRAPAPSRATPPFAAPKAPAANPWAPPVGPAEPASAIDATISPKPDPRTREIWADARGADDSGGAEHTVRAERRVSEWSLVLPGGKALALHADAVVLGRNPRAPERAPHAQEVAVDDVTRTVSKTHALLLRSGEGWVVVDLDSTNGVVVGDSPDTGREVVGQAPVEGSFFLGEAGLVLREDT